VPSTALGGGEEGKIVQNVLEERFYLTGEGRVVRLALALEDTALWRSLCNPETRSGHNILT